MGTWLSDLSDTELLIWLAAGSTGSTGDILLLSTEMLSLLVGMRDTSRIFDCWLLGWIAPVGWPASEYLTGSVRRPEKTSRQSVQVVVFIRTEHHYWFLLVLSHRGGSLLSSLVEAFQNYSRGPRTISGTQDPYRRSLDQDWTQTFCWNNLCVHPDGFLWMKNCDVCSSVVGALT